MKETSHAPSGPGSDRLPQDGRDVGLSSDRDQPPRRDTDPTKMETVIFQEGPEGSTSDPAPSEADAPSKEDSPPASRESRTFVPEFNNYQQTKLLGKGQFGEVWQALAPGGVDVAIKIVPWPSAHRLSQMELRALELMKRVRHLFLIQMHAYWPMENQVVVVMELADGSLEQRAEEYRAKGEVGIPRDELVRYIRQAAEALDYLHSQDIVHRDIKPANILLVGGHAKLGDFGIAKLFEAEAPQTRATLVGTPHFMAPEAWDSKVCRASDQYSLAATYLDLRIGLPQSTLSELMSGNTGLMEVIAKLPEDERRVLARALHRDPNERFESCMAMAEALSPASKPASADKQPAQSQWRKLEITASVGRGGDNLPDDVGKIQALLNLTGLNPPLKVDSQFGPEMIKAITEFQYRHTLQPDGLIEPDGPTLRALNRAYKISDTPVPDHRLVKLLGYGAFGEVWLAETSSGVKKALKLIPLDRGSGWKEFKGVFRVRDIRNPCLVSITDVWLLDTAGKVLDREDVDQLIKDTASSMFGRGTIGIPTTKPKVLVVAMQLCDKSLYDVFKEAGQKGMPREKLLRYMEDAARGLDWLNSPQHQFPQDKTRSHVSSEMVAIRHCDVKPENIMVVGGGAQVCDFGLAQIARAGGVRRRAGQLHASIYYAAPEMLAEDGAPSETTDQYSLALTYYHLRTGDLPFYEDDRHDLPALLRAHTQGRLDLSKLPERERKVIRRATSVNPKKRYKTCAEMVRALRFDQRHWWQDWGVAIAIGTILLSALVGTLFALQSLWWGPQQRLEGLAAALSSDELTCENVDELANHYQQVLRQYDDLRAFALVREEAVEQERRSLQNMLAKTAAWIDVPHVSCNEKIDDLDGLLKVLISETSGYPALNWDARLLQVRHDARKVGGAASKSVDKELGSTALVKRVADLRDEATELAQKSAGGIPESSRKMLLLDGLELALVAQAPHEQTPEALSDAFETLAAVQALRRKAEVASSSGDGETTVWAWDASWERGKVDELTEGIYGYFNGYEKWWARDRKTNPRVELLRQVFGSKANDLLPDPDDELGEFLANAADARRYGAHEEAIRNLKFAEALVPEQSSDAQTAAGERIDLQQLALWLSAPAVYRDELVNPAHVHSLAAPSPKYGFWKRACEELGAEERNPFVQAVYVDCQLHAADSQSPTETVENLLRQASAAASQATDEGAWYAGYGNYVQGMVLSQTAQLDLAATKLLDAYHADGGASNDERNSVLAILATEDRKSRAARVLFSAAEAAILGAIAGDSPPPGTADVETSDRFMGLTTLLALPSDSMHRAREFLLKAGDLSASLPAEHEVYELLIEFSAKQRDGAAAPPWIDIASRAEELIAKNDLQKWLSALHLFAADAIRQELGSSDRGVRGDLLEKGVEHYSTVLQSRFNENGTLQDFGDAVVFYEQVILPAVKLADSLLDQPTSGTPDGSLTESLCADLATIFRAQGMLIRKDLQVRSRLPDAGVLALAALHRSNEFGATVRSLLEEGYALIHLGASPDDLAGKLRQLAEKAASMASTKDDLLAAHELGAYALIHEGRILPSPASGQKLQEAIARFESALQLVSNLRSVRDDADLAGNHARILTGLSSAHVEYAVATRPATDQWREQLVKAEARAQQVVRDFPDREDKQLAWIAWGNALEDMAFYCDSDGPDQVAHFAGAIEKFSEAERICSETFLGGFSHATTTISLARCRIRRVADDALPMRMPTDAELLQARAELERAIGWLDSLRNSSSLQRYKAEAYYWLGRAIMLDGTNADDPPTVEMVKTRWEQAAAEVEKSHPHHWAIYELALAQYAWEREEFQKAADHAIAVIGRVNSDSSAAEFVSEQQLRDAIAIAVAAHPDPFADALVQNVEQAATRLSLLPRAEVFAEKCVYALVKRGPNALAECQKDRQQAEQWFAELAADRDEPLDPQDGAFLAAQARLDTAAGACLFYVSLEKARKEGPISWQEAYTPLKQATIRWNSLRESTDMADAGSASASAGVAKLIGGELGLYAKNLFAGANVQMLRRAQNKQNWDVLVKELSELLDANIPAEKKIIEAWEAQKGTIQVPK